MNEAAAPSTHVSRWLGDYRSVGFRELSGEAREALARTAKRAGFRALMVWVVVPLPWGLFFPLALFVRRSPDWLMFILMLAPLLLGGIAFLLSRDWVRQWRTARRALRVNSVEVFVLGDHVEEHLRALRALGQPAPEPSRTIEVCAATGQIRRVDGELVTSGPTVHAVAVAEPPHESLPEQSGDRPLTPSELAELRRLCRSFRTPSIAVVVVLGAWCGAGAILAVLGRVHGPNWAVLVIGAVLFLLTLRPFVRNRRLLGRVKRDIAAGVVRRLDQAALRERLPDVGRGPMLIDTAEELPHSGIPWTMDGTPARWRRT